MTRYPAGTATEIRTQEDKNLVSHNQHLPVGSRHDLAASKPARLLQLYDRLCTALFASVYQ